MAAPRDYYEILGVPRDADAATIKKSYRKVAMENHPDRNPDDPAAEARFKEASEAYGVLSDADKRGTYDRFGHDGLRAGGFNPGFQSSEDVFSHFSDLFGDLFGFGGGGGGGGRARGGRRLRRGADLEFRVEVEFLEAVHGCRKELQVPRHSHCDTCSGSGQKAGSEPETCRTCRGQGQVIQRVAIVQMATTCPTCGGAGQVIRDPCGACGGQGRTRITEALSVNIPAGVHSGLQLRVGGKGDVGDPGAPSGDLYVVLDVQPHPVFRRDGADVLLEMPVSYAQACLGGKVRVPTVDGDAELDIPRGTASGKVFTLPGKGAAFLGNRRGRGDQRIQVVVDVPKTLSPREEELLRELAQIQDGKVTERGFWRDFIDKLTS